MFVDLTPENLADETLCCIVRMKKAHPGVEAKRQWLAERLKEGHVFRKLEGRATVFMEYAPLEKAWVPIFGEKYLYIYCLWTEGENRGKGYGKALLESCLADARAQGRSGVCMLGAAKQKAWLTDQSFFRHFGFETVDTTSNGYELLALSFDGTYPRFAPNVFKMKIEERELTVYYDDQCPFIPQTIEKLRKYCEEAGEPLTPASCGQLAGGEEAALRVQQLGGVLQWQIFDGQSGGRGFPASDGEKKIGENARTARTAGELRKARP